MVYLKLEPEEYGLLKKSLTLNIQNYYDLAIDAFAVNDLKFAHDCIATKLEFEKLQNLLNYRLVEETLSDGATCNCCGAPITNFNSNKYLCNDDLFGLEE